MLKERDALELECTWLKKQSEDLRRQLESVKLELPRFGGG